MTTSTLTQLRDLVITREFDAPRELVWKAWTKSGLVKEWWGPEGLHDALLHD